MCENFLLFSMRKVIQTLRSSDPLHHMYSALLIHNKVTGLEIKSRALFFLRPRQGRVKMCPIPRWGL